MFFHFLFFLVFLSFCPKISFVHLTFPVVCRHVQVNNKGTLMLTGSTGDGVLENILWPDIPYITDQNGSKRTAFNHL